MNARECNWKRGNLTDFYNWWVDHFIINFNIVQRFITKYWNTGFSKKISFTWILTAGKEPGPEVRWDLSRKRCSRRRIINGTVAILSSFYLHCHYYSTGIINSVVIFLLLWGHTIKRRWIFICAKKKSLFMDTISQLLLSPTWYTLCLNFAKWFPR